MVSVYHHLVPGAQFPKKYTTLKGLTKQVVQICANWICSLKTSTVNCLIWCRIQSYSIGFIGCLHQMVRLAMSSLTSSWSSDIFASYLSSVSGRKPIKSKASTGRFSAARGRRGAGAGCRSGVSFFLWFIEQTLM